ncbi:biotin--[acetyl-CoA-carboxylase] ligase [Leptospirillum ferriphilum]|uniref:BirA bifunctional protein n=1 Tax=Leptospirillum ferriphilum TaxID=178606 RepID=A0A094W8Y1_9BACT|nr:biotin--[acetyl-CoA-carboxylase] ligase [Leptospirillum ferriphilum]KGA92960.1 birA bifunctional protein [Leptospirillum ferriphilum]
MFYLDVVSSTNSFLKNWSRKETLPSGTGLYAGTQTGGRGRRGNRWWHVPGNLALSIWVAEQTSPLPPWTLRLAWTLLTYLRSREIPCQLKYPNDIYLSANSLKLAGILVEKTACGAVLGLGLNRFLPEGLAAAACEDLPDHHTLALSVTELFYTHFLEEKNSKQETAPVLNELNALLLWKGEWVAWREEGKEHAGLGKIVELDLSGRLRVLEPSGNDRVLPETIRSVERVEASGRISR